MNKAYLRTEALLTEHTLKLKKVRQFLLVNFFLDPFLSSSPSPPPPQQLAEVLLEKEVLNYRDMVDLGPMPFEKKFHHHQELADLW